MRDLSKYNDLKAFQNYIDEFGLLCPNDFKKRDKSLYTKAVTMKFAKLLTYKNSKPDYSNLKTINDFQEFIKINKIKSSSEFRTKFNSVYQRASKLKLANKLKFNNTKFWRKLKGFNDIKDFQNFIDVNNIKSPMEFKNFDGSIYKKASNLKFCKLLKYEKRNFSKTELFLYKKLIKLSTTIETEKTFKWLKNRIKLRLDFFIPQLNLAIECQGKQHFAPNPYFGGQKRFDSDYKKDILKFNLCKERGISILYFVNLESENFEGVDFSNYFAKVYTDDKELITIIKQLLNDSRIKRN